MIAPRYWKVTSVRTSLTPKVSQSGIAASVAITIRPETDLGPCLIFCTYAGLVVRGPSVIGTVGSPGQRSLSFVEFATSTDDERTAQPVPPVKVWTPSLSVH